MSDYDGLWEMLSGITRNDAPPLASAYDGKGGKLTLAMLDQAIDDL